MPPPTIQIIASHTNAMLFKITPAYDNLLFVYPRLAYPDIIPIIAKIIPIPNCIVAIPTIPNAIDTGAATTPIFEFFMYVPFKLSRCSHARPGLHCQGAAPRQKQSSAGFP